MKKWIQVICAAILLSAPAAYAHVGSPDVYREGQAGPYKLSVVVRPPLVILGVAEVDVRAETAGIEQIAITPVPMVGEASKHPPVPDTMQRPSGDTQFFTGQLWIMTPGSWQIRFAVGGSKGPGVLSIPLSATAMATRKMSPSLGTLLAVLGVFLVLAMVGMVGAATREAKLLPGSSLPPANQRHGYIAMTAAFVLLLALVLLGNRWWKADAASFSNNIYKPLQMRPTLEHGDLLSLKLADPGWMPQRQFDDLIPDHNHLMHLYMIRWPQMDVVFHLHPDPVGTRDFQLELPPMPAGNYHLYADIVHANGFPETMVAAVALPQVSGRPLTGDDAEGVAKPLAAVKSAELSTATNQREEKFMFPDGYTMVWKMPNALTVKAPEDFRFELLDPQGKPLADMELYMGMLGHAAFVKTDGTVFAHIHPTGTVRNGRVYDGQSADDDDRNRSETHKLGNLVQQLLLLAGMEAGRCPAETISQVSLQVLCKSVVEDASFEAEHAHCRIAGSREDVTLLAYPQLLRRAIDNVLRNAVRYTSPGSEVLLNCGADEARQTITIEVLDSGPGVPDSMLSDIFLPFFRTSPGRESDSGGTGLGLSIAAEAIRMHDGSITARNRKGGGLQVIMICP